MTNKYITQADTSVACLTSGLLCIKLPSPLSH
jgi:hypothetical protein